MADSPKSKSPLPSNDGESMVSFYSHCLHNRFRSLLPVSFIPTNGFLSRIARFYESSKRRRKTCLPLPLPSLVAEFTPEAYRIFDVMEYIIESTLQNLHKIQKNLDFWQSKAKDSNARKAYFMLCKRGPYAFINGTAQLACDLFADVSTLQKLYSSASSHISERISVLTSLRYFLATFLAKVYMDIDRIGEDLVKDPENSLPSLLLAINESFLNLEASIAYFHANRQVGVQSGLSVHESYSQPLTFENLSEVYHNGSQWTGLEIRDAINLVYENIRRLDSYLSMIVSKHCKPRKVTLYWIRYSCGILGVSIFSLWLLRHSRLMGSSDIDNWIHNAKDSAKKFWNLHVEEPVLSIRDELFETFRKREKGASEWKEMQLTADSLHRTLLAFSEQATGKKFPEDTPDQEMFEIVMARYEKDLMHPIQGLVGGELVSALLIQVQKLKLNIDEAMLELDQIMRANKINFAISAALPAFFISLVIAMLVRAWLKQDTRAEGRGRAARIQRRLLLLKIKEAIEHMQNFNNEGLENDAQCTYGLMLCFLDSLYCTVEEHAKATNEWTCLSQNMIDLAKPSKKPECKLPIISRMKNYDCLLPSTKRS